MENYELIDSGNGRRLERFGQYIVNRPDPEVMWDKTLSEDIWQNADAVFDNGWKVKKNFPQNWAIEYDNLKINLRLTPFKHTGIFPEQEKQWQLIKSIVSKGDNFLSLFGYTGVASLMALKNGAKVTHVDASRPAITWFKQNQTSSNLDNEQARVLIDDCIKFTEREIKRGVKYDAVIMDPPAFGHGPKGEKWIFNKDFPRLINNVSQILSNNPKLLIVNAYAVSNSATSIKNLLIEKLPNLKGVFESGELTLEETSGKRTLSTGIYALYRNK